MTASQGGTRPGKGDRTRALILDTALRLFGRQSYERTTMRGIAEAAGVSVGSAYHYFSGKQELVQAFYAGIQDEHRLRAADVLTGSTDFGERLRGVLLAGVEVMAPYHEFASTFVTVALDPGSPSSPFSPQSAAARDAAIGVFREVVEGSRITLSPRLRAELPQLLWLAYLGVTLFWVHDDSPGQARTRALIETVAPMLGRLLRVARLPAVRSMADDVVDLVRSLRS